MNSNTKKNSLGKEEKLKSRKQIEDLFANGKGFTAYPVKVVYKVLDNEQLMSEGATVENHPSAETNDSLPPVASHSSPVVIGVSASSRNFKHAVDRNRIKRLLREAYRIQKHDLHRVATEKRIRLAVFFIYLDKTLPTFALLEDKMRYCLKRLRKILEETP